MCALNASAQALVLQSTYPSEGVAIQVLGQGRIERVSDTRLRIRLARKTLVFDNLPPHDEPLAGTRYELRDRREGFILLGLSEDEHSHGVLIDEETAALLPGGERVIFSPDRRAYFAVEQYNGMDAEVWKVYYRDGREFWSGASFLPYLNEPQRARYYLQRPSWTATCEVQAQAMCALQPTVLWPVKLVKSAQSEWVWRPLRPCPAAR